MKITPQNPFHQGRLELKLDVRNTKEGNLTTFHYTLTDLVKSKLKILSHGFQRLLVHNTLVTIQAYLTDCNISCKLSTEAEEWIFPLYLIKRASGNLLRKQTILTLDTINTSGFYPIMAEKDDDSFFSITLVLDKKTIGTSHIQIVYLLSDPLVRAMKKEKKVGIYSDLRNNIYLEQADVVPDIFSTGRQNENQQYDNQRKGHGICMPNNNEQSHIGGEEEDTAEEIVAIKNIHDFITIFYSKAKYPYLVAFFPLASTMLIMSGLSRSQPLCYMLYLGFASTIFIKLRISDSLNKSLKPSISLWSYGLVYFLIINLLTPWIYGLFAFSQYGLIRLALVLAAALYSSFGLSLLASNEYFLSRAEGRLTSRIVIVVLGFSSIALSPVNVNPFLILSTTIVIVSTTIIAVALRKMANSQAGD